MRLKSYFADSIEDAIAKARHEMGPDAMLIHSKATSPEARHLGTYEVVVCTEQPASAAGVPAPDSPGVSLRAAPPGFVPDRGGDLSQDVSELKRQMERLAITLARSGTSAAGFSADPELARAFAVLTNSEFDIDLAYELAGRIRFPASRDALRIELASLVRAEPALGCPGSASRRVAFVGPPGSGKTSSLVKTLIRYGISAGYSCQILSMDTYRIAAADELRSYAALVGVGCEILESAAALAQALEQYRHKNLILIDTPGLCRDEMNHFGDLAQLLAGYPTMDTHLVLPASMRAADMKQAARRYAPFKPRKLLFTRMDETETFGPILGLSIRMDAPLSFFSSGQRIPEDLEPASAKLILDLVMKTEPAESTRCDRAAA